MKKIKIIALCTLIAGLVIFQLTFISENSVLHAQLQVGNSANAEDASYGSYTKYTYDFECGQTLGLILVTKYYSGAMGGSVVGEKREIAGNFYSQWGWETSWRGYAWETPSAPVTMTKVDCYGGYNFCFACSDPCHNNCYYDMP